MVEWEKIDHPLKHKHTHTHYYDMRGDPSIVGFDFFMDVVVKKKNLTKATKALNLGLKKKIVSIPSTGRHV